MKVRHKPSTDKVEQQMTPMIDIVFQLLTFFVMSFKIASVEGNFDVKMPLASAGSNSPMFPPIKVRLTANPDGSLARIAMGDRVMPNFNALNLEVRRFAVPGDSGPGMMGELEVEIDADYKLHYENVVNTITAVSGYLMPDGTPVKLIEKIKFSQPRKPG